MLWIEISLPTMVIENRSLLFVIGTFFWNSPPPDPPNRDNIPGKYQNSSCPFDITRLYDADDYGGGSLDVSPEKKTSPFYL